MYDGQLSEYAPYRSPGAHGSVAKAKAAMKGSPYDTDHDGTCSDPRCKNVLLLTDSGAVFARMLPTIQADAAKLGITFEVRTINNAFPTAGTPRRDVAITIFEGWGKDYADPLTFLQPLFDSRSIMPQGNQNQSLVGITPAQAKAVGVTGDVANVPRVDAQLDRCAVLAGQPRRSCYEELDRTLMTKVVPWVPWLWVSFPDVTSSSVTKWGFDQSLANPAFAHVAVK
jgi:ABC-type transport system substrate-binding protein